MFVIKKQIAEDNIYPKKQKKKRQLSLKEINK